MRRTFYGFICLLLAAASTDFTGQVSAQATPAIAVEGKDQSPYYYLPPVEIRATRVELSAEERRRRYRMGYNVRKVYPYAYGAIEILEELYAIEVSYERKRDVRRFRKAKEKELKEQFTDELKKLSKTQGILLVDMIERHQDEDFYHLLKDAKNGVSAFFWQSVAKRFGQDLKAGYDPEADPYLESLLVDLDWP
jgi:hypothetical protein